MEHQNILILLNEGNNSKFVTRKWIIVIDSSNADYDIVNKIKYNTEVLKSNIYHYNDASILVRGDITVREAPAPHIAFTNCAPFIKCITKIIGTIIDYVEDLDLAMQCNLIEYSLSYSEATGSLLPYSKDDATNFNVDVTNPDDLPWSFKYKAKLLENTEGNGANEILKKPVITVPLKYLSNFWRLHKMSLINCKVELKIKWTKYCVLSATGN